MRFRVPDQNPSMRPMTRRFAFAIALSLWTALPSVETCSITGLECANACDEAAASKRAVRVATCPMGTTSAGAACATSCDRKPEPVRIAGRTARQAIVPAANAQGDPQQDPITSDRAWCIQPAAPAVPVKAASISLPLAPLWFANIAEASVLQRPLQAMGEWARRKSPPPKSADTGAPPLSRAPPLWVGELI
jgi:hypothetical protein